MFPRYAIGTDKPHARRLVRRSWRSNAAHRRAAGRCAAISRGGDSSASPFLYCHDGNKNVSEIVDVGTGEISAHYEYSAFGKMVLVTSERGSNAAAINPYRFSSEYHDDMLGLVYYNYRHYNPGDGRWTNRDAEEENGGVNLYAFCGNTVLMYVDERGENPLTLIPIAVEVAKVAAMLVAAAIAAKLAASIVAKATTQLPQNCGTKKCLPCDPPLGKIGYRTDPCPPGRPHSGFPGTHTHIYVVNQSPVERGCKCFWHPVTTIDGDTPPPGSVRMNGTPKGGGWYVAF